MTSLRRWLILMGALIVAGLMAFPLRETIHQTIVIPAAFIGWNLGLLYQSFSQGIWWAAVILIVIFMLVFSLVPRSSLRRRAGPKSKPPQGQVEGLAAWLRRAEGGIYFKWLIANKLGNLAYQILIYRENGRARSVFAPLVGIDWEPGKDLQEYLEIGLHGSFADFPSARRPLGAPQHTPLDHDIEEAVDFLESQIEPQR